MNTIVHKSWCRDVMIDQHSNGLFVLVKKLRWKEKKPSTWFWFGCDFITIFFFMEASNVTLDSDCIVTNHSTMRQVCDNPLCTQWSSPKWTPIALAQINSVGLIWPPIHGKSSAHGGVPFWEYHPWAWNIWDHGTVIWSGQVVEQFGTKVCYGEAEFVLG